MYGPAGERRLTELELELLPGYEGSAPVRIGTGAYNQHQLDVYGELMDALHVTRRAGLSNSAEAWRLQRALVRFLETAWREPHEGIWEIREPRRHFTHSKVMAWAAMNRAVKAVEEFGLPGEALWWCQIRDEIRAELFERLLALRNDVGLLSEEYDPQARLVGNFPQAFSHLGLINTARNLDYAGGSAEDRQRQ
jgi:GH15 family glucan-1,4-alpha-glucosidase